MLWLLSTVIIQAEILVGSKKSKKWKKEKVITNSVKSYDFRVFWMYLNMYDCSEKYTDCPEKV